MRSTDACDLRFFGFVRAPPTGLSLGKFANGVPPPLGWIGRISLRSTPMRSAHRAVA
jgi:hypothetical protein